MFHTGLTLLFTLETARSERITHQQVVYRHRDAHSRKKRQVRSCHSLEYSHEACLQSHIYKMADSEAYPLLGGWMCMECKEGGKQEIEHKTYGVAYKCTRHGRHAHRRHENNIYAVLKSRGKASYQAEPLRRELPVILIFALMLPN